MCHAISLADKPWIFIREHNLILWFTFSSIFWALILIWIPLFYLPIFRFSWYVYPSFTLGLTCIFHGACHFIYPCFCDKPILALFVLLCSFHSLLSLTLLFSLLSLPALNWLTSVSKILYSVIEQNSPLTQVTVYWLLSLQCHCSCWRDIGCWLAPIPSYVPQRANAMINYTFLYSCRECLWLVKLSHMWTFLPAGYHWVRCFLLTYSLSLGRQQQCTKKMLALKRPICVCKHVDRVPAYSRLVQLHKACYWYAFYCFWIVFVYSH